ncbi:hypothetical protein, partial [Parabacteroides sp.]
LMLIYLDTLQTILKGKKLFGITGFCLGAEIGLQLAYELSKHGIATPKLFLLNPSSERNKSDNLLIRKTETSTETEERDRITEKIIDTMRFRPYNGSVDIFLSSLFSKKIASEDSPEETDRIILDKVYSYFSQNPDNWKKKLPHCKIHFVDTDHWGLLKAEYLLQIKDMIQ